jgi:hypothetical protein
MESKIRLSILIASIPERSERLQQVMALYERYIEKYQLEGVQVLSIVDNKKVSIGTKRYDLIYIAMGEFIVMVDDDDELTEVYFKEIFNYINGDYDVVTYKQLARLDKNYSFIHFGLRQHNDDLIPSGITIRMAWTCCTWRKSVVAQIPFDNINWGEDSAWSRKANELAKNEIHINEVCHIYQHDSETTAAFQ